MRLIGKLLYGAFVVALFGVAALLLASLLPITGTVEIKIVKSGSMEPTIQTGSVVVVRPAASYQVGDVVVFGKDTKTEIPTTHRIIEKRVEGGQTYFVTKGDANEERDPREVAAGEVLAKVLFSVPYTGYILDFARQPIGFALLIGLPAALIIFDETVNIFNEVRLMRRRKKGEGTGLLPLPVPQKPLAFRERIPTI